MSQPGTPTPSPTPSANTPFAVANALAAQLVTPLQNIVLKLGQMLQSLPPAIANAGYFFAGPATGGPATPGFRQIASSDLVPIEGQYPGTATNDNAAAGNIGEYIAANINTPGSGLSNGIAANVTSISLPAGDWDVDGNVGFLPAGSTVVSYVAGWISTSSASFPTPPNAGAFFQDTFPSAYNPGANYIASPVGRIRISIAVTTTVYLSVQSGFTTSTMTAFGYLRARRAR